MFRYFCVVCITFPMMLNAEEFESNVKDLNPPQKSESDVYISNPTSTLAIKKGIVDIKEEVSRLKNIKAQKVYDYLAMQKKAVTDKKLLEIYYVILSFLRIQPNTLPEKQLRKKIASLLEGLNWLYSDRVNEKFANKVTHLGNLLKQDFFIHLNHQKMSECIDIVNRLKNVVKYSSLGNELSPEDGSDLFNPDFFLQNEVRIAQQIYSQVIELENLAKNFSRNAESLMKEQLTWNIKNANDFSNKLKCTYIATGDRRVRISRNTRKHLKSLISASIEKLIEKRNQQL